MTESLECFGVGSSLISLVWCCLSPLPVLFLTEIALSLRFFLGWSVLGGVLGGRQWRWSVYFENRALLLVSEGTFLLVFP